MKAFMIYSGWPQDGCLLVFAESANKAKSMCVGVLFDWEYTEMNSRRVKDFDKVAEAVGKAIIETNDDLPEWADKFYSDIEL